MSDLRASIRYLRRRPLLVWLSVGTMGVGLGVASTLFGVINALYLRPLPVDPNKNVVVIRAVQAEQGLIDASISRHDMVDLLADNEAVAAFGGLRDWQPALFVNDEPKPMEGIVATPGTFDVFGVKPHLGRLFTDADNEPDKNHVVLITWNAWKRRFGSDPNIVGRGLNLDGESFTVVGVLPERLSAPRFADAELWAPLSVDSDYSRGRGLRNLTIYVRLKPDTDRRAFGADLLASAQTLATRYPDTNAGWSARAIPLIEHELSGVLPRLLLLGAAALLLLLMACANMASLIFAESMARGSEYGLRAALGGSKTRLFRQLFADQLVFCLAGGASAVLIAWTLLALAGGFVTAGIPRLNEVRPDATIVVFGLGASVLLAIVFAAISLFWATRGEPATHIRIAERSITHAAPRWVSNALVASQVALAFVLLWSALSFGRAYFRLATASPGFDADGLLLVRVQAVSPMKRAELTTRSANAVDDLPLMPGVASATFASSGPLFGSDEEIGVANESMMTPIESRYANVDATFFDCLRIPIVAGQRFTREHDGRGTQVVILSRSLAAKLFPRGEAVGKEILLGPRRRPHTVIGIAADADETRVAHGGIHVYIPFTQDARMGFYIVVRGKGRSIVPAEAVLNRLRHSLPGFMIQRTSTMDELIESHLLAPKLQVTLLILFALGASILAAVAVFGMVTLLASNRAGEMGLRLALGATPRQTQLLLLRAVAWPVVIAVALGAVIVLVGVRHLPGISHTGPLPAILAVAIIVTLTIASSWRNVRTLARQEPMETLRAM